MQRKKRILRLLPGLGLGLLFLLPLSVWAANLITNDGLEPPFIPYDTYTGPDGRVWNLQVAHDWEKFIVPDGTYQDGRRLRFFSAADWASFNNSPIIESLGGDAQVWWSSKKFETGVYQQVSGLMIGEDYGFQAGVLQVFEMTDRPDPAEGNMLRSVGIDPYGGTDPEAATVMWGPEERNATYRDPGTNQKYTWFWPGAGAQAMSTTVTVFVRVRSVKEAATPHSNQVWVDDTFMDLAPTTSLSLNADTPTQVTATWSGAPRPGFHLYAYEAQYRKATDADWTDLQIFTVNAAPSTATSQSFSVEPGVEYVVRARTWHEQDGGDSHEVPGPWVEKSIVTGGLVAGKVLSNREVGVRGVTVQVSRTTTSTTSGGLGDYSLMTGPGNFSLTTLPLVGWTNPQPVHVTVANTGTAALSITLRPPDDVIRNGDFESNWDDWSVSGSAPATVTSGHRSGAASLSLSGSVALSQTSLISHSFQPVLSFWYSVASGDGGNFTAEILGSDALTATNIFTPLTTGKWRHAWLPLNLTEIYTGGIGVRFSLDQSGPPTVIYVDEVSLGSSWGGQNRVYLPQVMK